MASRTRLILHEKTGKSADTQQYMTHFTCDFDSIRGLLERALCLFSFKASLTPSPGFPSHPFDSMAEKSFFEGQLTRALGPARQLVELQRPLASIIHEAGFRDQRVDFCVEFPAAIGDKHCRGLIIELDGPEHLNNSQKSLDRKRDSVCRSKGWTSLRVPVNDMDMVIIHPDLRRLHDHPYFKRLKENEERPLQATDEGSRILDLVITPLAVARIHAVLLQLLHAGILKLDTPKWRLCFAEREFPCASLAVQDFTIWIRHIHDLYAPDKLLPQIEVTAFSPRKTREMEAARAEACREPFDAFIDVSVLQRYGVTKDHIPDIPADIAVTVRSSYRPITEYRLKTSTLLKPKAEGEKEENALAFFLRNIFRKGDFREGQLAIVRRTLRNQSSIGLLPTGAGKSLTYQLSALLQNGIVLVVDPIKSLMKDQVDSLLAIGVG